MERRNLAGASLWPDGSPELPRGRPQTLSRMPDRTEGGLLLSATIDARERPLGPAKMRQYLTEMGTRVRDGNESDRWEYRVEMGIIEQRWEHRSKMGTTGEMWE